MHALNLKTISPMRISLGMAMAQRKVSNAVLVSTCWVEFTDNKSLFGAESLGQHERARLNEKQDILCTI